MRRTLLFCLIKSIDSNISVKNFRFWSCICHKLRKKKRKQRKKNFSNEPLASMWMLFDCCVAIQSLALSCSHTTSQSYQIEEKKHILYARTVNGHVYSSSDINFSIIYLLIEKKKKPSLKNLRYRRVNRFFSSLQLNCFFSYI